MKFLIFDILYALFSFLTYFISGSLTYLMGVSLWTENTYLNISVLLLCIFCFLYIFVLVLGTLKNIFQPKLIIGDFPIGMNKDYIAWALNSIFCGIFQTAPFYSSSRLLFSLSWLFHRLMGMKLGFSSLVGLKTTIRQPELIEVGSGSILGLGCILSCHFTANGKIHTQLPIKIGNKSIIGGYSAIAPGTTVGNNSVVGAETRVFPNCDIGNNVQIGALCHIDQGVKIPDNVKIKSYSRIRKTDEIKSGEIWQGNPAQKIGEIS
ncbi:MAG: DapH/DapD/GlmU-related protein [Bdellovibrionota bacterium]|nr:DapH/DapD/GlmU-related protein [Bdellovibrionota bacterium]